jgi:hypothetical protein
MELGGLEKIKAKDGGQAAGVVMPDYVVPDIQPSQEQVQATDPRGHPLSFCGHLASGAENISIIILRKLRRYVKDRVAFSQNSDQKSFEFRVSSLKFVGRASVPAKIGCVPRTISICLFS